MVIISDVDEEFKKFQHCPVCGDILGSRGSRKRRIKHYENDVEFVSARRFHCKRCRLNHTELPSTVYPCKHYARTIINDILEGSITEKDDLTLYGPTRQTIRRWQKTMTCH